MTDSPIRTHGSADFVNRRNSAFNSKRNSPRVFLTPRTLSSTVPKPRVPHLVMNNIPTYEQASLDMMYKKTERDCSILEDLLINQSSRTFDERLVKRVEGEIQRIDGSFSFNIDEESFENTIKYIQKAVDKLLIEKNDIEKTKENLNKIALSLNSSSTESWSAKKGKEILEEMKNSMEIEYEEIKRAKIKLAETEKFLAKYDALLKEKEKKIKERQDQANKMFEENLENKNKAIEKEERLEDTEKELKEREKIVKMKETELKIKESELNELDMRINEMETEIKENQKETEKEIREREKNCYEKEQDLKERERKIMEREKMIEYREEKLNEREKRFDEIDRKISEKEREVAEKEKLIRKKEKKNSQKEFDLISIKEKNDTEYMMKQKDIDKKLSEIKLIEFSLSEKEKKINEKDIELDRQRFLLEKSKESFVAEKEEFEIYQKQQEEENNFMKEKISEQMKKAEELKENGENKIQIYEKKAKDLDIEKEFLQKDYENKLEVLKSKSELYENMKLDLKQKEADFENFKKNYYEAVEKEIENKYFRKEQEKTEEFENYEKDLKNIIETQKLEIESYINHLKESDSYISAYQDTIKKQKSELEEKMLFQKDDTEINALQSEIISLKQLLEDSKKKNIDLEAILSRDRRQMKEAIKKEVLEECQEKLSLVQQRENGINIMISNLEIENREIEEKTEELKKKEIEINTEKEKIKEAQINLKKEHEMLKAKEESLNKLEYDVHLKRNEMMAQEKTLIEKERACAFNTKEKTTDDFTKHNLLTGKGLNFISRKSNPGKGVPINLDKLLQSKEENSDEENL
ncbi:unnamed protein product [Blepharisma stoltei]|uniref:Uncharacterized protein n=1 Tax=Blepharisma stoltei TaxID=1481888 RepID=A0AAU9J3V8_9CILI|nr:unnamed protein product [Blepharisma stoltei]